MTEGVGTEPLKDESRASAGCLSKRSERISPSAPTELRNQTKDLRKTQSGYFGFAWVNNLKHDLRYAARQLLKGKGFTFVALIALALGLSANIMIYTMIDGFFFQPIQVQDADRLAVVTGIQNRYDPYVRLFPA